MRASTIKFPHRILDVARNSTRLHNPFPPPTHLPRTPYLRCAHDPRTISWHYAYVLLHNALHRRHKFRPSIKCTPLALCILSYICGAALNLHSCTHTQWICAVCVCDVCLYECLLVCSWPQRQGGAVLEGSLGGAQAKDESARAGHVWCVGATTR